MCRLHTDVSKSEYETKTVLLTFLRYSAPPRAGPRVETPTTSLTFL